MDMSGMRLVVIVFLLGLCAIPGRSQDQDKPLEFKFKSADFDAVLQYISKSTKWIFVNEAGFKGTVDAVSSAPIPRAQVLEFLNSILRSKEMAAVQVTEVVIKIVTLDEAKRKNTQIFYGTDPSKIEPSDRVITQIVPLKTLSLADFDQGLRALVPPTATQARDQANNALIITDSAENIKRFLEFVSRLDGADSILKTRVVRLKYADPAEVTRILTEFIRRGDGAAGNSPVKSVKIIPDTRTNSVVLTATEENLKMLEPVVAELDQQTGEVVHVKVYSVKGSAAGDIATTITSLLKPETGPGAARIKGLKWWEEEKAAEIASQYSLKAFSDNRTNSITVVGTRDQLDLVDRIVSSLSAEPALSVHGLKVADAKELAALLSQMTSSQVPAPRIQADPRTNSLLITASDEQLKLLQVVITELDRQIQESVKFKWYTLKNANPAELTELLAGIFKPQQQGVLTKSVDVVVNARANAVLIKAPAEYFSVIDDLIATLDSFPKDEEVTYVARLKSVDAKSVEKILTALKMGTVVSDISEHPAPASKPSSSPQPGSDNPEFKEPGGIRPGQQEPDPKTGRTAQPVARPQTGTGMEVQSEEGSNILVVRTTKRNLEPLKKLIKDLDQHRPQVLIKVLIAEVTLRDDVEYGVEGLWESRDGKHTLRTSLGTGLSGFSYLLTADRYQLRLQALAERGLLKILATPRILAMDNIPAKFTVGKRVPHITDSRESPFGAVFNTVFYSEVGIILRVTPKIYPDGMVLMHVNPEISDVAATSEAVSIGPGATAPTFLKNAAETSVTVKNGQTVILGGLIREADEIGTTSVPLLGDIPILGNLFSHTTKTKNRRELMIFLTPHVVYSQTDLEELTRIETAKLRLTDTRVVNEEARRWLDDLRR
jgi:general secretion pathway protein D